MKIETIAKVALQEDIDFINRKNLVKYIDKEFKGDTSKLKKVSKLIRDLTFIKER